VLAAVGTCHAASEREGSHRGKPGTTGLTHQILLWMTESKRKDAESAKNFAEKPMMDRYETAVVFTLNHSKASNLRVFLRELRDSAFR
jgi:hypothetical protein